MLASLLFPYDSDAGSLIDGWLDELEGEGCIVRYNVDGSTYLQVAKWLNHQKIDKPSQSKIPEFVEASRIFANPRERSSEDQGKDQGKDQGIPAIAVVCDEPESEKVATLPKGRKRPLPADFEISPAVRQWAAENGHTQLHARFEHFLGYVERSGKQYVDWDSALKAAIREDWAGLKGKPLQQAGVKEWGI
jgi:hypothetical protein